MRRIAAARGFPISSAMWLPAFLFGILFLLPHLVRIAEIGSYAAYSPFTAHSTSEVVWDESFLYGPEANYSLTHGGAPAYSDGWEERNDAYPYSMLPTELEALVAKVVGSLGTTHLLFSLVWPSLTFLLLMVAFTRCGAANAVAAMLTAASLLCAFSLRTLGINTFAFLFHSHIKFILGLGQARTPNPNVTLPMLLGAMLCLAAAIRGELAQRQSRTFGSIPPASWAVLSGTLGGLLFYSYVYYAIPWSAAVALLSLIALVRPRAMPRVLWISLIVTAAIAVPFLLWKHLSVVEGSYLARSVRLGLVRGHRLDPAALKPTLLWGLVSASCAALWRWQRPRKADNESRKNALCTAEEILPTGWEYADPLIAVILANIAGGLAGLNMQVVTGFNVQAALHFTHMLLQPLCLILVATLLAVASRRIRGPHWVATAGLIAVMSMAAITQFEAARGTGAAFRVSVDQRALFSWLNTQTPASSVVATDDLALSVVFPVRTHNSLLFDEGSRSTAGDAELIERFLFASRLAGASAQQVSAELSQGNSTITTVPLATYTTYLFETSPWIVGSDNRRIKPERMPLILQWFSTMNLPQEMRRFRMDYLWTQTGREPASVPGWSWKEVFSSADGRLWQAIRGA